jgi:hypothetical protein
MFGKFEELRNWLCKNAADYDRTVGAQEALSRATVALAEWAMSHIPGAQLCKTTTEVRNKYCIEISWRLLFNVMRQKFPFLRWDVVDGSRKFSSQWIDGICALIAVKDSEISPELWNELMHEKYDYLKKLKEHEAELEAFVVDGSNEF